MKMLSSPRFANVTALLALVVACGGTGPVRLDRAGGDRTGRQARSRGVIGVERALAGFFDVHFNRDVSGCTWLASYGRTGEVSINPGQVSTRGPSFNHPNDPTYVAVGVFDAAGNQTDAEGFSIVALCP
jgi:hypothetical protein